MNEVKKLYYKAVDGSASGVVALPKDMNEPVDLLEEDVALKSEWRIAIMRYTGGAEYRLMRYDECRGCFNDIGELKRFGDLIKKDLNMERVIPMREIVRHDYEEIIKAIEAIEA